MYDRIKNMIPLLLNYLMWVCQERMGYKKKLQHLVSLHPKQNILLFEDSSTWKDNGTVKHKQGPIQKEIW